jgi:hypothetical protein
LPLLPAILLALAALPAAAALAAEHCPNERLRNESNVNPAAGQPYSTQLPDCRAYELVSPPDTGGFEVPAPHLIAGQPGISPLVTADGSVFFESQATPPGTGAVEDGDYLRVFRSHRTASGWVTRDVHPTSTAGNALLQGASADGSKTLLTTTISLVPEDIDNPTNNTSEAGQDLYVVEEGKKPRLVTHGELPNTKSPIGGGAGFANADLSAVGFRSDTSLVRPEVPGDSTEGCYIWTDVGPRLAVLTNPVEQSPEPRLNCRMFAVTANGHAIIEDTNGDASSGLVFEVTGGSFPGAALQLSGNTPSVAMFDALSPDSETVYLTTTDKLTSDASLDTGADLYAISRGLLRPEGGPPTPPGAVCVSCNADGAPNGASVMWVGASGDGSHVFFTLAGELYEHDSTGTREVAPETDALGDIVFSHNGEHAIATTPIALSASDTNGTSDIYELTDGAVPRLITNGSAHRFRPVAVSDSGQRIVYEIEPGEGSAVISEWSGGQAAQVSPVGSSHGYRVIEALGPELEDVFFEAHDPLVPGDRNAGTTDIYDARVDGGFSAPTEAPNNSQTPNPVAPAAPAFTGNLAAPNPQLATLAPDTSNPWAVSLAKRSTRAQKLAKALKACKKKQSNKKRAACESQARRHYGANSRAKKATRWRSR